MIKEGEIKEGNTPPEDKSCGRSAQDKTAEQRCETLESHLTKRLADAVRDSKSK